MKKIIIHIAIIILALNNLSGQYVLDNTGGKINNKGVIRINNGQVNALPDTLGGRIEFLQKRAQSQQVIPNIVYNQLVLKNDAKKIVADYKDVNNRTKNLVVLDSLIISDSADFTTRWLGLFPEDVIARSTVVNRNARFDGPRDLRLSNDAAPQNIIANGEFSRLNIDNPFGVNVESGGFVISEKLTLTRGTLRNSVSANFTMADSTEIERFSGSSLAIEPNFAGRVDVRYSGSGTVVSSGELPNNETSLQKLIQANDGDLIINKNVAVNDSLYVGGRILLEDTLTLATTKTTEFNINNPNAEISGTLRINRIKIDGSRMLLHNPFTYAIFPDENAANGITELIVTVRPQTYPFQPMGNSKVRRSFEIRGKASNGQFVDIGTNMIFGYAWRYRPLDSLDEQMDLPLEQLVLQSWQSGNWIDIQSSLPPQWDTTRGWAFSYATNINSLGYFAIGNTGGGLLQIAGKLFLEGAYRFGSMADDLRQRGYLPMPPPDIYPYNLDPMRQFYVTNQLPDSVVDWVVVEFRKNFTQPGLYRTYLVKRDGRLVDIYGNDVISIVNNSATNRIDSGDYYIAIRHRNHLAIITKEQVSLIPGGTRILDFTSPDLVMGGINSLKRIDKNPDGRYIYGMIAGEINGSIFENGRIDFNDYNNIIPNPAIWSYDLFNGYLVGDINMDGIITTLDFNISFNNRKKVSAVP